MPPKQKTPRKPPAAKEAERQAKQLPMSTVYKNVGRAFVLLTLAGISSTVSQLSLSPVYGSIPASFHHQRCITGTALLAFIGKGTFKRYLPPNAERFLGVIAYYIPLIQFFIFQQSATLDTSGPLYTELLTYFPLLLLSVYTAGELLEGVDLSSLTLNDTLKEMFPAVGSYATVSVVAKISASMLPAWIGTHLSFTRVGLQLLMASLYALVAPSVILLVAIPAILHTMLANPHYPSDKGLDIVSNVIHDQANFTILDRQESITGYISVLEASEARFRVLRCDHSLLGGEWLVTKLRAAEGQTKPETIFSVFAMLEAVRLIEDEESDKDPIPDSQKSALVVGLGIGTAPNALISHGIDTTIVELDPVVHHYATKYFSLSPNHTAVIDDAVPYVASKARTNPATFNYIIHDVFTGGAEPAALFTKEFLQGLYDLLTEDGSVAINYAGDLSLPSTRLILNTIHTVFPACRLFRDQAPLPDTLPGGPDFINMVVFCVKNDHGKGRLAVNFRKPDAEDFAGSIARMNFLLPKQELEVDFDFDYKGVKEGTTKVEVLQRANLGALEQHQKQGALSHWKIMRTVLPPKVWETW